MDSEAGKLFIGGISWETTEEKLKNHFSSYGEVVDAVIMKEKATGRARGFGFVAFADPAVADRALLDKHTIDGRVVEAKKALPRDEQQNPARGTGSGPRTKKIFVGGLPSTITDEDFRNYFGQFGNITDAVVMYDAGTQRPRGFGFITYDSEDAVGNVLQKNFHELKEKLVEVKPAVPKELSTPGGRSSGAGFGGIAARGGSFNNGPGPGYNSSPGNTYGGRMDNRYGGLPPGRPGYSPYGPGSYGAAPYGAGGYGSVMNGGYAASAYPGNAGFGAVGAYGGGYGSAPGPAGYGNMGAYGTAPPSGMYAGSSPAAPRSPWGSSGGIYPGAGSPAGYGANGSGVTAYAAGGWGSSGSTGQPATGPMAYGYGGRGYGSAPTGDHYGASSYQRPGPDHHSSPLSGSGSGSGAAAGYGMGGGSPAEGYGMAGKQSQRGPDTRFRPYPMSVDRPA